MTKVKRKKKEVAASLTEKLPERGRKQKPKEKQQSLGQGKKIL